MKTIAQTTGPRPGGALTSKAGGVLIYALVIVALSSLLLTAWIELMIVRGNQVNAMEQSIQRRIGLANSRAMLRQYLMTAVVPAESGSSLPDVLVPGGWGGIGIVTSWSGSPFASSAPALQVNHFNPGQGGGYLTPISAVLLEGTTWMGEEGQVHTRSPVAGARLLTVQAPTLTPGATLSISGGMFSARGAQLWRPSGPNSYSIGAAWFTTPENGAVQTSLVGLSGTAQPPSNLAWTPRFTTDYAGSLDVVDNPSRPANSLAAKIEALSPLVLDGDVASTHGSPDAGGIYPISSDGAGNVIIGLDQAAHSAFRVENAEAIELTAGPTPPTTPLRLLINQGVGSTRDLNSLSFTGSSTRPVVLALKKSTSSAVTLNFPSAAGSSCQLWATVENTPLVLTSGSGCFWLGGLRTDRSVDASGADLILQRPTDLAVESELDREGWVEIYRP